ncbi:MAG: GspE/PulE family protein [Candidatus Omnitrophota bacterium]
MDKFKKILQSLKLSKSQFPVDDTAQVLQPHMKEAQEEENMLSLAKELDIPPIRLSKYLIDIKLLELIPEETARTYYMIPLARLEQRVTIAVVDPFNIVVIDMAKSLFQTEIYVVIATASDITRAINKYYTMLSLEGQPAPVVSSLSLKEDAVKIEAVVTQEEAEEDIVEIQKRVQEAPIIQLVNTIFSEALKLRASDIHIEPFPEQTRMRYRIDGILHEMQAIPKDLERAVIARIKIMSNLDITQRRLPQDGRLSLNLEKKELDCRVSILPVHSGEKAVLRLLEKGAMLIDLEKLGFSPSAYGAFKKAVTQPHGMILLTGPTGSGKSTTLYAMLNTLDRIEKNIITIEDPVEYQMAGITQIHVKPEINLTFAKALRSILRQNPNIIMIGEIRDFETVDIAMKAALTGHLILSTLHTNDAPSAIVRLMNMQVEPFLISYTLLLVAAQRLCRRICSFCKEPYNFPAENLLGLPPDVTQKIVTLYKGKGCARCNHTGYYGRIPVVQALLIDDTIREMILKKVPLIEIRDYAHTQGMKTLREDAIEKVLKGEISLEEALRITPEG